MKVLVVCEFSGKVRDAFIKRGHDAWSNDILPTEQPGPHLQCDCVEAIKSDAWDLIMMHLPCTKIALSGNGTYGKNKPKHGERIEAIRWTKAVWQLATGNCKQVGFENPKNVMGRHIGKRTQVIHPYEYGHPEMKETWLWLHGLPKLRPTRIVYDEMTQLPKKERERIWHMSPSKDRGHVRSITYQGIADAMAEQWSRMDYVSNRVSYPLFEREVA